MTKTPIEALQDFDFTVKTGLTLYFEPNPHRGWTSDNINRMMQEKIESGEIDPKVLKIKHTENPAVRIKKCHNLLREMGL